MNANSLDATESCVKSEQPSTHVAMAHGAATLQQGQLSSLEGVAWTLVSSAAGAPGIERSVWTGANNKPMLIKLANVKQAITVRRTI